MKQIRKFSGLASLNEMVLDLKSAKCREIYRIQLREKETFVEFGVGACDYETIRRVRDGN